MLNANKKNKKKKIIPFLLIGLVIITIAVIIILGGKKVPIISVQVEKVERKTITQSVTATGKIYPEIQVTITPEVSGEVIYLAVRDGQKVRKNDILLKIKPDFYIARRDQMAAGVTSSGATLRRIQSEYNRAKELYEKKLISEAELEQAKTSFEVAKAQFEQAQAALNQANEDLNKTVIYSPMDGTVTQLKVELGERVLGTSQFQGTAVMTIADLSRMECRVDVGENDIVLISLGDTARIEIDAFPNRKFTGVVYEIANTAKTKGLGTQEEVTNFEVKVRILDKDVVLRPGMSVTATIETETKEKVLAVPIQSITTRTPKDTQTKPAEEEQSVDVQNLTLEKKKQKDVPQVKEVVFLYNDGTAKMVEVKRGISDNSYVEIIEGLNEGNMVISGSYKAISRELEDGSKVKIETTQQKKSVK